MFCTKNEKLYLEQQKVYMVIVSELQSEVNLLKITNSALEKKIEDMKRQYTKLMKAHQKLLKELQ